MQHHGVARTSIELATIAAEIIERLHHAYGDISSWHITRRAWHNNTVTAMYDHYNIEIDVWGRYIITTADSEIVERGTLNQLRGLTTLA